MRRIAWAVPVLLLALAAYVISPFVTLYELGRALQARDAQTLVGHIDFPTLRASLAAQLTRIQVGGRKPGTRARPAAGSSAIVLTPVLVEALVTQLVTPTGVRAVVENGWLDTFLGQPVAEGGGASSGAGKVEASSPLKHWAFSSPARFRISFGKGADPETWVMLRLRFAGFRWQIYDLELPAEAGRELLGGRVPI